MDKNYKPRSGRHTITGILARNILNEIFWTGVPESGNLILKSKIPECNIGYYNIKVKQKGDFLGGTNFYVFTGKTLEGQIYLMESAKR